MNEKRLKNNASFASALTIQNNQHTNGKKSTPSVFTEKSVTIAPETNEKGFKKILKSTRKVAWALFLKYWFLLGLLVAIILAIQFPDVARKGGYIRAEWTIKWGNNKQ